MNKVYVFDVLQAEERVMNRADFRRLEAKDSIELGFDTPDPEGYISEGKAKGYVHTTMLSVGDLEPFRINYVVKGEGYNKEIGLVW